MPGDEELLGQDDIERLLSQSAGQSSPVPGGSSAGSPSGDADVPLDQSAIEAMLSGGGGSAGGGSPAAASAQPPSAAGGAAPAGKPAPAPGGSGSADVPDADKLLKQDDIDRLLQQAGAATATRPKPADPPQPAAAPAGPQETIAPADVEFLLQQAQEALSSIDGQPATQSPMGVRRFDLQEFSGAPASTESATLDLVGDVELDVQIELGRTQMSLDEVLRLRNGSVVPLDKLAGDPVDIYVNGRLIARGEILVLNDNFCVRVGELVAGSGLS